MPIELEITGYLTAESLREQLAKAASSFDQGAGRLLLLDLRAVTGYEPDAREVFVQWHRKSSARLARTAVITDKPLWPMVVAAMGVASATKVKSFTGPEEARAWLLEEASAGQA